jgi:hypothetical protein
MSSERQQTTTGSAFSEDDDKAPDSHPFIVRLLLSGMQMFGGHLKQRCSP